MLLGLPWWSSNEDFVLPLQGARVQSLVGEWRPHVWSGIARKKKKKHLSFSRQERKNESYLLLPQYSTHRMSIAVSSDWIEMNSVQSLKCDCEPGIIRCVTPTDQHNAWCSAMAQPTFPDIVSAQNPERVGDSSLPSTKSDVPYL